jgi:DNA polymerase elongation subunit (family B)
MSSTYTYVSQRGNNILSRGYHENGERFNRKDNFQPTMFVDSKKSNSNEEPWHDIHGKKVYPVKPGDISDCKDFVERYKDVSGFNVLGMTNWVTQYIGETFNHEITPDFSKIRIFTVDIETCVELGKFPKPETAEEEILLITVHDSILDRYIVYSSRPVRIEERRSVLQENGVDPSKIKVSLHQDEHHLLKNFTIDWATMCPDALTGWNIETFDVPYLVRRINFVLGESFSAKLSPWGKVRERFIRKNDDQILTYDIDGVSILDYMALMRKFTYGERSSWKLGDIAQDELGQTKLEMEGTFKESYTKDFQTFVAYNIIDVFLVERLDRKLKLIELAYTIAYMAKINPDEVFSPIRTWDSIIYNHLKGKGIVVPEQKITKSSGQIAGGYVKEPQVGKHKWVVSFDLQSLYPHLMMWRNMSPDTINHEFVSVDIDGLLEKKFNLNNLPERNISLAANGHTFKKDKRGFLPELMDHFYRMRSLVKKDMLRVEQEYATTKDDNLTGLISSMNAKQMAVKIL